MKKECIYMLGDSLIDFGNWPQRLTDFEVRSKGIPGERAEELRNRLPDSGTTTAPGLFMLMIGTNDLFSGDTTFTPVIGDIVRTLLRDFPTSEIILTGLPPFDVPGTRPAIMEINRELNVIAEQSSQGFLELFGPFDRSQQYLFDFDGVHLNESGYQLWSHLLKNYLTSRLAKNSL